MTIVSGIIGFFIGMIVTIFIIGLCRASGRADLEYQIAKILIDLKNALKELDNVEETNINCK